MPSTLKIAYFMGCASCTALAVALLGLSMSRSWAETRLDCSRGDDDFNGSATITWELFSGNFDRQYCPLIGSYSSFNVFSELADSGAPVVLSALVVLFLVVCLVCSAGSILIALYNSVSNPYETYMGPIGVYVCSSISACLSALVLVLYAVMITTTTMAETVVYNEAAGAAVLMNNKRWSFHVGFFLVVPYTLLSLGAVAVVYLYDHTAYTQRREQQRPTEDAPKEIMMY